MVEEYGLTLTTVIECDVERTTQRNDQLAQPLVGMTAATLAARNVVDPVGTPYLERYVLQLFSNSQVAAWVGNLRKFNDFSYHRLLYIWS